jgi:membrane-bound lytic murein transglycosylase D
MPMTAHGFDIKHNYWYDGRRDVVDSTRAALSYLTYLGNYFNDDWLLASAAYNAGEGTVSQAIQRSASNGRRTDFWSLPLPHETQDYVPRLLAMALIIDHPNRYGVVLPAVDDYPYFDQVTVKTQIELKQAAKLAKVSSNEIEQLNAGFSRHRTAPATVNHLNLPIEKVEEFKQNLETYIATHKNITHVASKKKSSSHRKAKRKHTARKVAKKSKVNRHAKKRHHVAKKNSHRAHKKIG